MEVLKDRSHILTFLESVANQEGLANYNITNVKTNAKGEGFLGEIFMITLEDTNNGKKLEIVIKAAFTSKAVRDLVPIAACFQNETYFYSEVYTFFKKFEKKRGVLLDTKFVPKCYKIFVDAEKELLCLENMKTQNFKIFEKTNILDEDHISLIFKTYGRFHAYSFALKDQMPEDYRRLTSKLQNIYRMFNDNPNGNFKDHMKQISDIVQTYLKPGKDDKVIEKFRKYLDGGMLTEYLKSIEENCDYSAILHGDCWSNNMIFKYEEGKPIDMRLLDLQIVKLGSPVCDLSYCLYSGASKKVYDDLETYLKIYHDSFSSFLRELGSDPQKLFPFEALKEDWKKYSRFGMIMGVMIWRMKCTDREEIIDLQDVAIAETQKPIADFKGDEEKYEKSLKDILYHMLEIDAL